MTDAPSSGSLSLAILCMAGVQFGMILLGTDGSHVPGTVLLKAGIPAFLVMAFGAMTTMSEHHLRAPWDDSDIG